MGGKGEAERRTSPASRQTVDEEKKTEEHIDTTVWATAERRICINKS